MTAGIGASDNVSYPYFLQKILGNNKYNVINLGRTMITLKLLVSWEDLFVGENIIPRDIVCYWCGTNDLYKEDYTGKELFEIYDNYYNNLAERGLRIIPFTFLPRSNLSPKSFESQRLIFNELVRNKYNNIADLGADKNIGYSGAEFYAEYYNQTENTHLNNNGYKYVADIVANIIKNMENNA
jgi:lysophospholipase L1-like esterase